jgi:hypothetical protein
MAAPFQADELCDIFEILAEDVTFSLGQHRHGTRSEIEQPLLSVAVVQNVDGDKVDVFVGKKLFRSEAAASARLGEQNKRLEIFHSEI